MIEPYYQRGNIDLYHADAGDLLPDLAARGYETVVTDPVWPNARIEMPGSERPYDLFREVAVYFPRVARRVVVQLGCDSDPRFLAGMPNDLKFLRACTLDHVPHSYKGRMLYTHDIAYVFGEWPASKPGARVLPGRVSQNENKARFPGHPVPRREQHVRWLVHWFGGGSVIDPFAGSGTTLAMCFLLNIPAIGIEISEAFCEVAARRLDQLPPPLPEAWESRAAEMRGSLEELSRLADALTEWRELTNKGAYG